MFWGLKSILFLVGEFGKSRRFAQYNLNIIDNVGGGMIYVLLNNYTTQVAVAASVLKHSIEDDNMVTISEVEKLAGDDGSGRIHR